MEGIKAWRAVVGFTVGKGIYLSVQLKSVEMLNISQTTSFCGKPNACRIKCSILRKNVKKDPGV